MYYADVFMYNEYVATAFIEHAIQRAGGTMSAQKAREHPVWPTS